MRRTLQLATILLLAGGTARADEVGCVSTTFRVLGLANDKICIDAFRDPKIDGVVCHVSRAKTGGVKGAVGLAEDTSDAAVSCRQIGPITIPGDLSDGEDVFRESRSVLFKHLQVVRFYDKPNNTLVYLSYTDRVVEGRRRIHLDRPGHALGNQIAPVHAPGGPAPCGADPPSGAEAAETRSASDRPWTVTALQGFLRAP